MENSMEIPQKSKIKLPFDPAIPLLGIYPEKTMTCKDTDILMFIAAPFAIAKTWKQPKCPSIEEWIKKRWYIYTMKYYSAIKRNEITGVPTVAQGKRIQLGSTRLWAQSLASLSGLRIWCCRELWCRSKMRLGSGFAVAGA